MTGYHNTALRVASPLKLLTRASSSRFYDSPSPSTKRTHRPWCRRRRVGFEPRTHTHTHSAPVATAIRTLLFLAHSKGQHHHPTAGRKLPFGHRRFAHRQPGANLVPHGTKQVLSTPLHGPRKSSCNRRARYLPLTPISSRLQWSEPQLLCTTRSLSNHVEKIAARQSCRNGTSFFNGGR